MMHRFPNLCVFLLMMLQLDVQIMTSCSAHGIQPHADENFCGDCGVIADADTCTSCGSGRMLSMCIMCKQFFGDRVPVETAN